MNLPRLQAETRLQQDIQATKTIAITVLAFLACYIPSVCIGAWVHPEADATVMPWPGHVAYLSMFLSSGINPIIYCYRVRRFRRALKQLLNDPCGKTAFQEADQDQRFKENKLHHSSRGKKIVDKFDKDRLLLFRNSSRCTRRMALTFQVLETKESSKKQEEECGRPVCNQPMPLSIQKSRSGAWVENCSIKSSTSRETQSGKVSPAPKEDYTRHEVIVEVHPVPYDKPLKRKRAKTTTPSEGYTRKESNGRVHRQTTDELSKQKITESQGYINNQTVQKCTDEEDQNQKENQQTRKL